MTWPDLGFQRMELTVSENKTVSRCRWKEIGSSNTNGHHERHWGIEAGSGRGLTGGVFCMVFSHRFKVKEGMRRPK